MGIQIMAFIMFPLASIFGAKFGFITGFGSRLANTVVSQISTKNTFIAGGVTYATGMGCHIIPLVTDQKEPHDDCPHLADLAGIFLKAFGLSMFPGRICGNVSVNLIKMAINAKIWR